MAKKVPVSAVSLSVLSDGYTGKAIDAGLRDIQRDIIDRGHDGKARTLTIKVTFTPDERGRCQIDTDVGTKLPGYKPPPTMAKYDQHAGGLVFNPDCGDNPEQAAIPGTGNDDD